MLELLGKLEYGFAAFCYKMADRAVDRDSLRTDFIVQARAEESHAKMLLSCAGMRFIRRYETETGCQWGSDRTTDEHFDFEGISQRYKLARYYFGGKTADSFNWPDTLAFLTVGESWGNRAYWVLSRVSGQPLKAIASKIATDERSHGSCLWQHLTEEVGVWRAIAYRAKWEFRAVLSILRWVVCR